MADAAESWDISAEQAAALGAELAQAFNPRRAEPGVPAWMEPEEWTLEGGMAWVWRVPGNATLTKPVIIADGFSGGASKLEEWAGLWTQSKIDEIYPWGTQLHAQGRDVIVLGYDSRSAPIRTNADVAIQCIQKAAAERSGDGPLVVGGLSMGGLVTRYALAKLESDDVEHQVGTYFSYDSPHQGAWIPISLQVFAHFMSALAKDLFDAGLIDADTKQAMQGLQQLINSTAARELLWRHTETHLGLGSTFTADPKRQEFLDALEAVGSFPQKPRTLGVANGRGDGEGLDVTPGAKNLNWPKKPLTPGAALYAQAGGTDKTVAELHRLIGGTITVKTSDIPELDGAPGGTLDSFAIAAKSLTDEGYDATVEYPEVCFVPVASAVDLADPSDPFTAVNDMDAEASGLHEFKVASQNERHTLLTQELCDWLTERF